jgi:hypothetical protein
VGPDGSFEILALAGNRTITTRLDFDGAYSQRSRPVPLRSDTNLGELLLPAPVSIESIDEIPDGAQITWSATDADDFREYKVYRHDSSGLDETTGTLIHVATDPDELTFVDADAKSGFTYYYRVFVLNDFGLLGGSNIESVDLATVNLLANGGFEDSQGPLATGWSRYGNDETVIAVDDTTSYEGQQSMRMDLPNSYEYWVEQAVDVSDYDVGDKLRFSGMMRASRANADVEMSIIDGLSVSNEVGFTPPAQADQWVPFDAEFTLESVTNVRVGFWTIGPFDEVETTIWLDDLRLESVQ